jgi:hypothetical protein
LPNHVLQQESGHKGYENGWPRRRRDRYSDKYSESDDDTDFDNDEESDGSEPPPLPPRMNRPEKVLPVSDNGLHSSMVADNGPPCNGTKLPSSFDIVDKLVDNRYADRLV